MVTTTTSCDKKCPMCSEPGKSKCLACKEVMYCSKACQESDWPFHKHVCKTAQKMKTRPSEDMRRVLLFPADGTKPELVWRSITDQYSGGVEPERPEFEKGHFIGAYEIDEVPFTRAKIGYRIYLRYDDMSFGSPVNEAVRTATDGKSGYGWMGPLLAYSCRCKSVEKERFGGYSEFEDSEAEDSEAEDSEDKDSKTRDTEGEMSEGEDGEGRNSEDRDSEDGDGEVKFTDMRDMTMADYSYVVQFLVIYLNQNIKHLAMCGPKVEGVKILCDGERIATGADGDYHSIKLPRSHPQFQAYTEVSAISERIGMPIKFTKCKTSKDHNTSNQPVASMHTCIDPDMKYNFFDDESKYVDGYFGWPKPYWGHDIGTVLLTRVDGRVLDVETVEAFASFCDHVLNLIRRTEEQGYHLMLQYGGPLTVKQALAGITAQKWKLFFADWKAKKAAALEGRCGRAEGGLKDVVKGMGNVQMD